jgi:predicted O-methyltransferase YrrM
MNQLAATLMSQLLKELAQGRHRVAVVGRTAAGIAVAAESRALGCEAWLFDPELLDGEEPWVRGWSELAELRPDVVVIASDLYKEALLRAAADATDDLSQLPSVVLSGLAHQELGDAAFADLEAPALVSSYATGHPHTRRHLYDCLRAAAAADRRGTVVELGAFKGGTSVWLARAIRSLGLRDSPVIAFDSWEGFPERRSLLDLYAHPRCVFSDLDAVRRYTEPYGIELVPGDIFETAPRRLAEERILLAFVDTDNYSGARVALTTIAENLVPGGAIVLDHFFTTADYAYTVGERMAATETLLSVGLLHLHGTGTFIRIADGHPDVP